jgi:D-alanyl-D-alanine carboxypeptidase/D-alanyl-D-alanine-endopeptidase (penicillin-binding protein 4)
MRLSRYPPYAQWGLSVVDQETGDAVYDLNGDRRYVPGSTTKLFPAAAALAAYGPNFRFETPVYRLGAVEDGALRGDLVLVAGGDVTMGGRDQPDGTLAFSNIDHTDANAVPGFATLTAPDPLAGLNTLAEQVAGSGIRQARDVVIDARLWDPMPKDDYVLSPIMINDNVVDLILTPGTVGDPATLDWRPTTAYYDVRADVRTVAADQPPLVTVGSPAPHQIVVEGEIPAGIAPLVQTFQVDDPADFAHTLFVEALARHDRVALLRSLPFAEVVKVILKVSMNRGADTLVFLLAVKEGKRTFEEGLQAIRPFLESIGVDAAAISLGDGRGNDRADLFSPRSVAALLVAMAHRPESGAYYDALPVLGVDGTEFMSLPATSPARGKIVAKSGTTVVGDLMNQAFLLLGKADAGYLTAKSGRRLVWAVYVNDVSSPNLEDVIGVGADLGTIAEAIYEQN